ncbi:hypothetical protein [Pseudonocardia alaniniphila]|uniref:hypothetical protein n=1 Tax=Pseudonocardia alaniniphila TaxID=75291 RepID=UPI001F13EE2F|nr:hypothetical protein [Pseudonocardia alaniniphila]
MESIERTPERSANSSQPNGFAGVQYVHDIVEADGMRLPSRRRATGPTRTAR